MDARLLIVIALVLGTAALTLFFWTNPNAGTSRGITARYFERNLSYRATCHGDVELRKKAARERPRCLRDFAEFERARADRYVWPLLFPLDLFMMMLWAAALALASVAFGAFVPSVAGNVGLLIALPVLYFLADLYEDTLLAWLLTHYEAVTAGRVGVLKTLTALKLGSLIVAHVQLALLIWLAGWAPFKPPA